MKIDPLKYLTPTQRLLALVDVPARLDVNVERHDMGRNGGFLLAIPNAMRVLSVSEYKGSTEFIVYEATDVDEDGDFTDDCKSERFPNAAAAAKFITRRLSELA